MNYLLILLFSAVAIPLLIFGFSFRNGERAIALDATAPNEDRDYWKGMGKKITTGFFTGAAGAILTAISIALLRPIPAEIGCITLMASMVFPLAFICRKIAFTPCKQTELLQKRWKTILLLASFGALFLTQLVFQYFNTLS